MKEDHERLQNVIKVLEITGRFITSVLLVLCFPLALCGQQSTVRGTALFDGRTLAGWKSSNAADRGLWSVKDSVLTGGDGVHKIASNTYLQTEKGFGDFELRFLFRLSGNTASGMINSGVQYRSRLVDGAMVGYQADIGNGYWGDIYDEHRRGKLVGGDIRVLKRLLREDGWNSYIVRVRGNHHELYINGIKTSDYIEKDTSIPAKGIIAIQLHSGGTAVIELRDIVIDEF